MPRFNVQHPVTKEWRCFSTIVEAGEIRDANLMDYEEAEQIIADRERWEEEDEAEGSET